MPIPFKFKNVALNKSGLPSFNQQARTTSGLSGDDLLNGFGLASDGTNVGGTTVNPEAPPAGASAGIGEDLFDQRVLSGDLLGRFQAALSGLGYQQYNDDNPLGPQGYWAPSGRGGSDWLNDTGDWAGYDFAFFGKDGGLDIGYDDRSLTGDPANWNAFLGEYGSRLDPALVADLRAWLG